MTDKPSKREVALEHALLREVAINAVRAIGAHEGYLVPQLVEAGAIHDNDGTLVATFGSSWERLTAAEYLERLRGDELLARVAFANSEASTKGTAPRDRSNPWRKGDGFNLTEQMKITRENPALAKALEAAADAA